VAGFIGLFASVLEDLVDKWPVFVRLGLLPLGGWANAA